MPEKLLTGEELPGIMQSTETSIRMCFTRRSLTDGDYAKYRDIYPDVFYKKIVDRGLCLEGQEAD